MTIPPEFVTVKKASRMPSRHEEKELLDEGILNGQSFEKF
jgi:hypothetical protein